MIVRLTKTQKRRMDDAILASDQGQVFAEAFDYWLSADWQAASHGRIDLAMPAIAWKVARDVLFDLVFDHRGFRRRNIRVAERNGLKQVQAAVNMREAHPAVHGIGAIGAQYEMVPLWKTAEMSSPYPLRDGQFKIAVPLELRAGPGRRITQWDVVDPDQVPDRGPLLQEKHHLRFVTQSGQAHL